MASIVISRGKTLPDGGEKADLHDLIDLATASITNIVNADVSSSAAIAGTKISPTFGSQDVTTTGEFTGNSLQLPQTTAPTTAASEMAVYTKDTSGQPELFVREESDGDEVQVTSGGRVNVDFEAYVTTDANQVGGTGATLAGATSYQALYSQYVSCHTVETSSAVNTLIQISTNGSSWTTIGGGEQANASDNGQLNAIIPKSTYWRITPATEVSAIFSSRIK